MKYTQLSNPVALELHSPRSSAPSTRSAFLGSDRARLGRWIAHPDRELARLDPTLGWLALDGFGFHEGYFHASRTITAQTRPPQIRGYAALVHES